MTVKRATKSKTPPKKLKLNKKTLRDLAPKKDDALQGGAPGTWGCLNRCSYRQSGCL